MNPKKYFPFFLLSYLPLPILYFLSYMGFLFLYYVFRYRREVVLENLKISFPEKNETELRKIAKQFYKNFCDLFMEDLKSLTMSKEEIFNRFQIENKDLLVKFFKEKRNVILYTGHVFNWEWFNFLPLYTSYHCSAFFKKQKSSYFNDLLLHIRSRYGIECIESKTAVRHLLKLANSTIPFLTIMIGDQSPTVVSNKSVYCRFFQKEIVFLNGTESIARKVNAVVLYPHMEKVGMGKYKVRFELIDDYIDGNNSTDLVQKYAALLEQNIKEDPTIWLWSHKRWKHSHRYKS